MDNWFDPGQWDGREICRDLLGRVFSVNRKRHVGGIPFEMWKYLCGTWDHSHCAPTREMLSTCWEGQLEDGSFMIWLLCLINQLWSQPLLPSGYEIGNPMAEACLRQVLLFEGENILMDLACNILTIMPKTAFTAVWFITICNDMAIITLLLLLTKRLDFLSIKFRAEIIVPIPWWETSAQKDLLEVFTNCLWFPLFVSAYWNHSCSVIAMCISSTF